MKKKRGSTILGVEAHNIIKPRTDLINTANRDKVKHLRRQLMRASNAVVVLFTATPVVDEPRDARDMASLICGRELGEGESIPEGYVSWFMARPRNMFAAVDPGAEVLPPYTPAVLHGRILKHYLCERFGLPKTEAKFREALAAGPRPGSHDHPCVDGNRPRGSTCKSTLASYENLAFYVHRPDKSLSLQNADEMATKANAIAQSIAHGQAPPPPRPAYIYICVCKCVFVCPTPFPKKTTFLSPIIGCGCGVAHAFWGSVPATPVKPV